MFSRLLRRNIKKIIPVNPNEREEFIEVLIQDGHWFLVSAEALFGNPFSMFAGSVLAHHGIELLLKACWIWDRAEYSHTHDLIKIANQISFLRRRDRLVQNGFDQVNTFYSNRYPMDDVTRRRIQRQLDNANANVDGIPTLAGEGATDDWQIVAQLRDFIVDRMPDDLFEIYERIVSY